MIRLTLIALSQVECVALIAVVTVITTKYCVRSSVTMPNKQMPFLLQRAQGITPDLRTYTSLLSGCGFARDPSTAHDLVIFCTSLTSHADTLPLVCARSQSANNPRQCWSKQSVVNPHNSTGVG